ncbi:MAG: tetratricopeptide repeat protein, partial [Dactylosporangium sp.]|nr:tetratricopeptide repeat protein [Dactylosporangium sp.]
MPAPTPLPAVWRDARALRDRGDVEGARTLLENAVQTGGTTYGRDHPDVLETARMLAALYREMDELPAARRTLEQALAAGQRSLPADHPL